MDKAKRNAIFVGVFIVIIMVGSILAMWEPDATQKYKYNGYEFYPNQGTWTTRINSQNVQFLYLPQELENTTVQGALDRNADKIYIAHDSNDLNYDYPLDRLKGMLYYFSEARFVDACIDAKECINEDYPLVDCKDSSSPILYLRKANESLGYTVDKCLILEAKDSEDLNLMMEKVIYRLLGVMN